MKPDDEDDPLADLWLPADSGLPNEYETDEEWTDAIIAKAMKEGWDFEEEEGAPDFAEAAVEMFIPADEEEEDLKKIDARLDELEAASKNRRPR